MRPIAFAAILAGWSLALAPLSAKEFPELAYELAVMDLGEAEYGKYAEKARDHYKTWINDNPSENLNRFLNDKLLPIAMGVPKGEIKTLKKFIYWLGLYHAFKQFPPSYIRAIGEDNNTQISDLRENFSWERMSEVVRKRAGETSDARRKEYERMMKE